MSPRAQKRLVLAHDAREARAQVNHTLKLVRARMAPRALVGEAAELIAARATEAVGNVTGEARKRPLLVTAGTIGAALAVAIGLRFKPRRRRETKIADDRSTSGLEIE